MRSVSKAIVTAACVVLCALPAAAARLTKAEAAPYMHPQQLVSVAGHRLNVYCTGHGSPTVILEAGEGETTFTWRKVQPKIATFTRVCSYDRAGMGFSDAGPVPRDARSIVSDLHGLLRQTGIPAPYVLVGHSSGGMYATLFADLYPRDVAGMVLVDSSFPNQTQALEAASPTLKRMDKAAPDAYRTCYEAAFHRRFGAGSSKYAMCGFPAHASAMWKAQCAKGGRAVCGLLHTQIADLRKPGFWLDLGSEDHSSATVDSQEVLKAQRGYGAMPLIVLTAANDTGPPPPFPKAEVRAIQHAWVAGHERIARLSSVGVNFVVRHSGHLIQVDRPSVVTSAVAEVISQARSERR